MSHIVLGVDGGGSKTHVIVADHLGATLGEATGPGSATRRGHAEDAADVIASVMEEALVSCNMQDVSPRLVWAGVAGVGREAEREALWQALRSRNIAQEVVVHSDFSIALDDAFPDGAGVLLIAGTGSVAYGRSPTGGMSRCGGWGPVCGDEGSGAWIGRRALSIVTASADGREPSTALMGAILTAAEVNDVDELVSWTTDATPAKLASLAPIVFSVADAGDLRANALVSLAVEELALHVRALARALFGDERAAIPVALGGGALTKGSTLRKRLEHRLKSSVPGAQLRAGEVIPARGAVRDAIRFLGSDSATSPSAARPA